MSDVVNFPSKPSTQSATAVRASNPYHELEGAVCDCKSMSSIAVQMMANADNGKNRDLVFAVFHLDNMLTELRLKYYEAYRAQIEGDDDAAE